MSLTTPIQEFLDEPSQIPSQRGQLRPADGKSRYEGRIPSYYNKAYGLALVPVLNQMIASRKDKEFLKGKIAVDTVYQRVHQAFAYCLDYLDPHKEFEKLRSETLIRRTPGGVVLCFKENSDRYDQQVQVQNVLAKADAFNVRDAISVNWRQSVHEFVEDANRTEIKLTDGFALTPKDQAEIASLIGLVPPDVKPIEIVKLNGYTIHLRRQP